MCGYLGCELIFLAYAYICVVYSLFQAVETELQDDGKYNLIRTCKYILLIETLLSSCLGNVL